MPKKKKVVLRPKGYCWRCREETLFKKGSTVIQYISGKKMHAGKCEQCGQSMTVMASGDSKPDVIETKKQAKARLENKKKKISENVNVARKTSKKRKRSDEYKGDSGPKTSKLQERIDRINAELKRKKKVRK